MLLRFTYIISYVVHLQFLSFISYKRRGKRKTIKEGAFITCLIEWVTHHGASYENIDQQGPSSVQSVTGDTSLHTALEVKSDAATSLERPIILDKPKGVSSGSSTLKEGMMQTETVVVLGRHVAQENQNQHQTVESKCSLSISCTHAVTQTNDTYEFSNIIEKSSKKIKSFVPLIFLFAKTTLGIEWY